MEREPPVTGVDPGVSLLETLAETSPGTGSGTGGTDPSSKKGRGDAISRYVILEQLGEGGMGVVYAAYDPDLDRKVAIKLLHDGASGKAQDSIGRARLLREAQALAKVAHPHVIAVHDVGLHEGRVFLAMEFVDGLTLRDWQAPDEGGPPAWREVLSVYRQAALGLGAAHEAGLVHRDFKPDNVLLGRDGRARVLDFGIARREGDEQLDTPVEPITDRLREVSELREITTGVSGTASLTQTGALVGTPAYMAPEQFEGAPVDARSDQFSFCVALWEALYGERPFAGGSSSTVAFNVRKGRRREPPADSPVPRFARTALERGLSTDPGERFPDMAALVEALVEPLEVPTPSRRGLLGLGVTLVLLAGAGIAYAVSPRHDPVQACVDEAQLDAVWNEEAVARVQGAFEATGASYATDSAGAVRRELDAYADRWRASWRSACEATHAEKTQSLELLGLQQACLDRRRMAVEALVEVFATADDGVVSKAAEAVAGLPDLEACSDATRLLTDLEPPTAEQAEAVAQLRRDGVGVQARLDAGKYEAATEQAVGVLARAREVGYRPAEAEARVLMGRAMSRGSDLQGSRDHLADGLELAVELGHTEVTLDAAILLIGVAGMKQSRYAEGMAWYSLAAGLVARDPESSAALDFHDRSCSFLADQGEAKAAMVHCERAVAMAVERYGPHHLRTAQIRGSMGRGLYHQGRNEEALAVFSDVLEVEKELLGDRHPALVGSMNAVGVLALTAGDRARALEMSRATVALCREALGRNHPTTAVYSNNLAEVELVSGHIDEAEAAATEGLRILTELYGTDHPGVGASHVYLGRIAEARGEDDRAAEHLRTSVEVFRATRGNTDAHDNVIESLRLLAALESRRGHHEEALKAARRAWAGAVELDPEHPRVPETAKVVIEVYEAAEAEEDAVLKAARAKAAR